MVADPFASMADAVARVADDVRALVHSNCGRPALGSPAAGELDGDLFYGEWGSPARVVVKSLVLSITSCHDHLRGASVLLRSRAATLSPFTVIRGAAEAAAVGSYLADPAIDQRERTRRGLNYTLAGVSQERLAIRRFAEPEPRTETLIAEFDQLLAL